MKPCWYCLPAVETSLLLLGCGVIVSLSVYFSSGTGTSECSDITIDPRTRFRIFNKANVPPVRSWAIDQAQSYSARIGARLDRSQSYDQAGRDRATCVDSWWSAIEQRVVGACGNETDPRIVETVLRDMGIYDIRQVRDQLSTLLSRPVALLPLLRQAGACVAGNEPLSAYACAALEDPSIAPSFFLGTAAEEQELCFAINFGVVLQELTEAATRSPVFQATLIYGLERHTTDLLLTINEQDWGHSAVKTFVLQKSLSVSTSRGLYSTRAVAAGDVATMRMRAYSLMTNMFEAIAFELAMSSDQSNVILGLNLATEIMIQVPGADEDGRARWPLGRDWVDAYNAWDLGVVSYFPLSLLMPTKLLIPAVSCADFDFSRTGNQSAFDLAQQDADLYLHARAISLRLTLTAFVRHRRRVRETPLYSFSQHARESWANISAGHSSAVRPASCGVAASLQRDMEMLYPRDGYPPSPPHWGMHELLSYEHMFRLREDRLVENVSCGRISNSASVGP